MKFSIPTFFLVLLCSISAPAQDLTSVDFHVRDVEGDEQSFQTLLQSVRGPEAAPKKGVIMISFWAMWCEPCKKEMKAMVEVFEKYKEKNFHYLAINIDNPRSLAKVKNYITAQKLPYLHWTDPNSEVFKKLNGQNMPYSLMVNEQGKLLAKRTGFLPGEEKEIENDIKKYLD